MHWHLNKGRLRALLPALTLLVLLLTSPPLPLSGAADASVPPVGGSTTQYYATFGRIDDGQRQQVRVMLHLPPNATARQPVPVLVALHGYGGNGEAISRPLLASADRLGWAVVAPTTAYRDWRDPAQVCEDASDELPGLRALLTDLPARTGLRFQPRVMLYGFSRGAQYAHRFALAYPEMVASVAAMSAGTYTLPQASWREPDGSTTALNMPYGVADLRNYTGEPFRVEPLRQVRFFVAVGSDDHESQDVPDSWDKYIGDCRRDRANAFVSALQRLNVPVEFQQFSDTKHEETAAMRAAAVRFLSTAAAPVQVSSY